MSSTFESLTAQGLALPQDERLELALRICESIETQRDIDPAILAEATRLHSQMKSSAAMVLAPDLVEREIRDERKTN